MVYYIVVSSDLVVKGFLFSTNYLNVKRKTEMYISRCEKKKFSIDAQVKHSDKYIFTYYLNIFKKKLCLAITF